MGRDFEFIAQKFNNFTTDFSRFLDRYRLPASAIDANNAIVSAIGFVVAAQKALPVRLFVGFAIAEPRFIAVRRFFEFSLVVWTFPFSAARRVRAFAQAVAVTLRPPDAVDVIIVAALDAPYLPVAAILRVRVGRR